MSPENQWFPQSQVTISNQDDFQLYELVDLKDSNIPERPHALFLDLSVSGDSGGSLATEMIPVDDINQVLHPCVPVRNNPSRKTRRNPDNQGSGLCFVVESVR